MRGYRPRPDARTVALARWNAAVPADGARPLEIRTDLPNNRIARVLICLHDGGLVALHAFIKKTQKTPDADLAIARKRLKELTNEQ